MTPAPATPAQPPLGSTIYDDEFPEVTDDDEPELPEEDDGGHPIYDPSEFGF